MTFARERTVSSSDDGIDNITRQRSIRVLCSKTEALMDAAICLSELSSVVPDLPDPAEGEAFSELCVASSKAAARLHATGRMIAIRSAEFGLTGAIAGDSPFARTARLEHIFEKALAVLQNSRGGTVIQRDRFRDSVRRAISLPLESSMFIQSESPDCFECGGTLLASPCGTTLSCIECGIERDMPLGQEPTTSGDPAPVPEGTDYRANANGFLRRLQGNERCNITPAERDRLVSYIRYTRVSGRNINVKWFRTILQETKLTKYNEFIPWLACDLLGTVLPQLTCEDSDSIAVRVEGDVNAYLQMRQNENLGGKRCHALPNAYLVYRAMDEKFPPGDPRRRLLRLIHLPKRNTFEEYETLYWRVCQIKNQTFFSLGAPDEEPFACRPPA